MGTWSHEPFGNDTACDWAYALTEQKNLSIAEQALQRVLDNGDAYLDADLAVEAIAASEVFAKALGRGTQSDPYTESVDTWLKTISTKPTADQRQRAQAALARILGTDSELRELWEEGNGFEAWETSVKSLQSALGA